MAGSPWPLPVYRREMPTGVTVLPEYFQNEGVNAVLDKLASRGVGMVATSPYVMEPADPKSGTREPPIDAGAGSVRLLDRPLWGKRELFVRTSPSFVPNKRLYQGLAYQPATPDRLTESGAATLREFFRAAQRKHLETYLQVQAAIPPGYRVQFGGPKEVDRPRLPDGRVPPRRLANNGSLGSNAILQYTCALMRDLAEAYPEMTGIRLDWPEYPPYFLDDLFLDFNPQCAQHAMRMRMDFPKMQQAALELYRLFHGGLKNRHLERFLAADGGRTPLLAALLQENGLHDWLTFKAGLVTEFLRRVREALPHPYKLVLGVFPPPFHLVSGMNFGQVAPLVSAFHCKLYTMHWPVIFRFYGEQLQKNNPNLDEELLVEFLSSLLQIQDRPYGKRLDDFRYPEPEEPHPVGPEAQRLKVRDAQALAGETPVFAFVHGYGPVKDFAQRLQIGREASPHGVWINRYGYLRDEKLDEIGRPKN